MLRTLLAPAVVAAVGLVGSGAHALGQNKSDDRTAELAALAKFVIDNRDAIGELIAEATGGVTSLKTVVNHTGHEVVLWKVDKKLFQPDTEEFRIPAKTTADAGMWIPWADDAGAWKDHHMLIKVGGNVLACLWQDRGVVRMKATEAFVPNGTVAPGNSKGGGDRVLHIVEVKDKNGNPSIAFVINGKK